MKELVTARLVAVRKDLCIKSLEPTASNTDR
jgi:hypothetical protein